jgi:hypothetical protein
MIRTSDALSEANPTQFRLKKTGMSFVILSRCFGMMPGKMTSTTSVVPWFANLRWLVVSTDHPQVEDEVSLTEPVAHGF